MSSEEVIDRLSDSCRELLSELANMTGLSLREFVEKSGPGSRAAAAIAAAKDATDPRPVFEEAIRH